MNMQPLYELKERLENCTMAGVGLIDEDFRLKRAAEQFASLAAASPILKKIDTLLQELLLPATADRCTVLMDVLALVNAVAYTQGTTQVTGEIAEPEILPYYSYCDIPYSVLKPLHDALNTTGSGRLEVLMAALKGNNTIIWDFRLLPALLHGLGDIYGEFADAVEQFLASQDKSILPALKQNFEPKGAKDMQRRIRLVDSIAGAAENDWYLSLLDITEKEMRSMAIRALRHDSCNASLLLDLAATEKGNCKKMAQYALSFMDVPQLPMVYSYWEKMLQKNPTVAQPFLCLNQQPALSELIAKQVDTLLDALLTRKEKIITQSEADNMEAYLQMLRGRFSPSCLEIYRKVSDNSKTLSNFKQKVQKDNSLVKWTFYHGANNFAERMAALLTDSLYLNPCPVLFDFAEELYARYDGAYLAPVFMAALLTKGAQEVYDRFGALFALGVPLSIQLERAPYLLDVLHHIRFEEEHQQHQISDAFYDEFLGATKRFAYPLHERLSYSWFSLLKECPFLPEETDKDRSTKVTSLNHIFEWILDTNDEQACYSVGAYFDRETRAHFRSYYLNVLARCRWKACRGLVVKYATSRTYNTSFQDICHILFSLHMSPQDNADELKEVDALIHSTGKTKNTRTILSWPSEEEVAEYIAQVAKGESY